MQISNKSAPDIKKTINEVTHQLKTGEILNDDFDNDKIIMRPKALGELKGELTDPNRAVAKGGNVN